MERWKTLLKDGWQKIRTSEMKAEWIVLLMLLGFSMFTMFYIDFQATMNWAYQIVESMYHGEFGGLKYILNSPYGVTLFLIFILWCIPYGAISSFIEVDTKFFDYCGKTSGAVWSKLFLVVVICFFVKAVAKIAVQLKIKETYQKWIPLFLLSSALFFLPVIEVSQCDIVGLTFSLWGLYYYMIGDRKKFLIMFAVAIPMKYFPLMMFVPLVLLHEKKIGKIIFEVISGCSILVLNILYRKLSLGSFVDSFSQQGMQQMSGSNATVDGLAEASANATVTIESNAIADWLGSFFANTPVFIVLFLGICIFAYYLSDKQLQNSWAVYLSGLVYTCLYLFLDDNPYRMVMMVPFLVLLVFTNQNHDKLRLAMLLETIFGWGLLVISIFECEWVTGGIDTFSYLFLRNIEPKRNVCTFFSHVIDLRGLLPYVYAVVLASIFGIFLCNRPSVRKTEENREVHFERWIIWCRIGLLAAWIATVVYIILVRPL